MALVLLNQSVSNNKFLSGNSITCKVISIRMDPIVILTVLIFPRARALFPFAVLIIILEVHQFLNEVT